jgi:hypothetical protein
LSVAVSDVLGTRVGRLVAGQFADPARLAQLGVERFRGFAARRGVQGNRTVAGRLVAAARAALPTAEAGVARQVLTRPGRRRHEGVRGPFANGTT